MTDITGLSGFDILCRYKFGMHPVILPIVLEQAYY